jgi:RNA polymerase sigma-70 factor (ECF subfamily)
MSVKMSGKAGGDQELVRKVKEGERSYLKSLYDNNRKAFILWASRHYSLSDEDSAEIYQRSFITFYYNVRDGKLTTMNSSLRTYLFAIGKNLIREHYRAVERMAEPLEVHVDTAIDHNITVQYEEAEQKDMVRMLLEKIGEPCNSVLRMFYFDDSDMKTIAAKMNYKTEQIAAKRKFICLQQMRKMMVEMKVEI